MRISRIYHPTSLKIGETVQLSDDAANHVGRVLRQQPGHPLVLFNGDGYDYSAVISESTRKRVTVDIHSAEKNLTESPLKIELLQVISRGDKMDLTIQKAVELGVSSITPIISERCGVKLNAERFAKKIEQWQKIVYSACEQCGRAVVPKVKEIQDIKPALASTFSGLRLNLHPQAPIGIRQLNHSETNIQLLIGPEGGLSDEEIELAREHGFTDILMGPRVLRTETAGLAAISMLQCTLGDMG
ncbi:16S rRNA m(3)U1498 methyltransferase [Catenovulum agarivorans DS-2]|uniref:Ribosomal RNA small subunit methyltransferase E n=1 Tax=Catenovulum agarivorans DS-2 TaxID=1328313 RepID=W7R0T3_9ALTE|nr:16S rRNA (uracil(1498)-N(3))-methyltransferase [Catenovulum agarivorans]EWH11215.1 16S rRNA m(3)U1498 methyltransferase [Catenovulum agarivorans DS-2]